MKFVREIVFGAEDALVSTLGAVTGVAAGAGSTFVVVLTGIVLIAVEATSMAAGSYLSTRSASDAEFALAKDHGEKITQKSNRPITGAFVMWFSYAIAGIFPLLPYFFLPIRQAYLPSIIITAIILFALGASVSRLTKRSSWKGGTEMVVISLFAAGLGYLIGRIVSSFFGVSV